MTKNLLDIYTGVKKNNSDRRQNDFYATPPLATYVLHKYVYLPQKIVEPCAGRGNISIELLRNGYDVKSYDLHDYNDKLCNIVSGQDVLDLKRPEGYEGLITNPPYFKDLPMKIMKKGIQEYDFTALFVRYTFLEGMKRYKVFTETPPSDIIFLSDRINFTECYPEAIEKKEQIGGMIAYCWVIFNKYKRKQDLKWVLLKDEYSEWRQIYDEWLKENVS